MIIPFFKYQGTGNDFIMIDNRALTFPVSTPTIKQLCDRHFGIGADGLILLENEPNFDFKMVYFNSDGNESTMCGNGGRSLVAFAHDLGIIKEKTTSFLAIDGPHQAEINILNGSPIVKLKMMDVSGVEQINDDYFLNTGSPHYIIFQKDIDQLDIMAEAKKIRYNNRFAAVGTNVNFVEVSTNQLYVRTYERGVEGETFSCGTGVTAAALATYLKTNNPQHDFPIHTLGGHLHVYFTPNQEGFSDIWLEGPAQFVFEGKISI